MDLMDNKNRKVRFSMLRSYTVADLFTIGNAASGTISIFLCLNYIAEGRHRLFWIAFALLFAALGFDVFDGYWARRSRRQSILGADMDSLSDIISFGVAPAVLGFTLGMRGAWDMLILVYFVVCGISRLARFNVTAEALSDESGESALFRRHSDSHQRCYRRPARSRVCHGSCRGFAMVGRLQARARERCTLLLFFMP